MGAGDLPSTVLDKDLDDIRVMEDPESGYVLVEGELPASSRRFVLHQQITAMRGMFAGQAGLFLGRTDAARVRVLFQLLGQPVEQEMMLRDIA
jgi:hypothetical protein